VLRASLFILLLGRAIVAMAAEPVEQWVPVEASAENPAFAVDVASIQRKGETVTFRERVVFANPAQRDAVSGKLIKEKHALRVMRCNDRTQGVKSGTLIDENGRVIESVSVDDHLIHWLPIPPGSVAEREFDLVCERKAADTPAAKPAPKAAAKAQQKSRATRQPGNTNSADVSPARKKTSAQPAAPRTE
jgi:hypothetical protein